MVNYTIGATALLAITLGIATVNATEIVEQQQHQNLRQQNDNNEESTISTQQKQRKVSYYRYGGNDAYLEKDDEEYSPFGGTYGTSHHHKPKSPSFHTDTDNSYQDKTNKPPHHHDVVKVGDATHDKWTADGWESSKKKWHSDNWDKKKHDDDDDDSWKCTHKPHKRWSSSSSSWDVESSSKLHTIDDEWSSSSWSSSSSSSGKSGKSNSHHGKSGKSGSKSSSSSYDNPNGWGNISTWGSWSSSSSSSGKSGKSGSNYGKSGKSGSYLTATVGKSGKSGRWSMNKTNRAGWSSPTICHTDSPTSSPSVKTQELIVYYSSEEGRLTAIEQATEVSHDVPDFNFVSGSYTEEAIAVLEDDSNIDSIEEDQTIVLDPIDDSYYPDDDITDSTSRLLRNGFSGRHNHRNLQTEACDGDNRTPCVQKSTRQSQGNLVPNQTQCRKKVCILDTGYDLGHEDLPRNSGGSQVSGTGTCNNCPWNRDSNSHGTHVAGTVAAVQNQVGVVGIVEKDASLYIVRVFQNRSGSTSAILAGLSECRQNGGDIVNMSLGGGRSFGRDAFRTAYNEGMLLVAAAGNSGNSNLSWPASENSVISVASTDADDSHSSFSQTNGQVEMAAFGRSSLSTLPGNRYGTKTGTSMASPVVAGVASVVWSTYPGCTNVEIRDVLRATAISCTGRPTAPGNRNNFCGYGIVQAKAAIDYIASTPGACRNRALCPSIQPPPTRNPTPNPTPAPTPNPTPAPTPNPTKNPTQPPIPAPLPTNPPFTAPTNPPVAAPTNPPFTAPTFPPSTKGCGILDAPQECPADAVVEDEPCITAPGDDICDPIAYELQYGETGCGTMNTYDFEGNTLSDQDTWFFDVPEDGNGCVQIAWYGSSLGLQIDLYKADESDACVGTPIDRFGGPGFKLGSQYYGAGQLTPGKYGLRVTTASDSLSCGSSYTIKVDNGIGPTAPPVTAPTNPPEPSNSPTREPTGFPSSSPSRAPSNSPVLPTSRPTDAPVRATPNPTGVPSTSPTTESPIDFTVPDPTVVANDDRFTITCDWNLGMFPVCTNEGRLDVLFNDEPTSIRNSLYIERVQTQPPAGFGNCDIGKGEFSSGIREVVVYTPGDNVREANDIICEYTVCIPNTLSCDTARINITLREKNGVKIWDGGEVVQYQN